MNTKVKINLYVYGYILYMEYKNMLDRAQDKVTDVKKHNSRFEIPDPELLFDGSFTEYKNFHQTAEKLNRDDDEMLTFFQEALATNGSLDGQVSSFKGKFSEKDVKQHLSTYFEEFVQCDQCESPDTTYKQEYDVDIIYCTACGATRPKPE